MFNYHELDIIKDALELNHSEETTIYQKVVNLMDTMWYPGHVLPPMYAKFLIEKDGVQYEARRTELAESYSPKTITLLIQHSVEWDEETLNVGDFKWRYL
ncbi:hypothetical protein key_136 [Erwinia phage KEY]|uniref:Uncharacterized protein n=1 Tax=Erwinia phage KEY TaxID=2821255 RepID=A0AAE8BDR2_9CAUD|nr:hypothetical protein key_136 [Erwinia phage KEY]